MFVAIPHLMLFLHVFFFFFLRLTSSASILQVFRLQTSSSSMETSQHFSNDSFSYSWLMNIKSPLDASATSGNGAALRTSLDAPDGNSSFIEMDPKLFSKRWSRRSTTADSLDFDFHLPTAQPGVLVHADQLFADGLLLPLHLVHHRPPKTTGEAVAESPTTDPVLLRSLSIGSSESLISRSNRFRSCYSYEAPRRPASTNASPLCGPLRSLPAYSSSGSSSKSEFATRKNDRSASCKEKKLLLRYLCYLLPLCKKVKGWVWMRKTVRSAVSSAASCVESNGSSPRHSDAYSSRHTYRRDAGAERDIYDAVLHCKNSFGKS
ncbi:hypothetical protein Cni_G10226 [Canna indica]|uniref:Membrane-associated kinase regulator 6 n=1 Tax=Canna indica TaxID=4628 RepID=A0AAQ3K3R5_9LILI|nr:hypothetical protein Cni_G10226 [Canna indica]